MRKDVVLDAFASGMYAQAPESLKTEVADLRTGEDGTVYASAGDAVREQTVYLRTLVESVTDLIPAAYKNKTTLNTEGAEQAQNNRITTDFIRNVEGVYLKLPDDGSIKARVFFYDENLEFTGNYTSYYTESFETNRRYKNARFVLAYSDDRAINYAGEITSKISILKNTKWIMKYRGEIVNLGYTSFQECKDVGYYSFEKADLESITDAPDGLANSGILIAYYNTKNGTYTQEILSQSGRRYFRIGSQEFALLSSKKAVRTKWYALGDSIVQGYYSEADESGTPRLLFDASRTWVKKVAEYKDYALTNCGVGGSGYVHNATVGDKLNARDHVDAIDFSGAELVTIAYGVNDWKYNERLGTFEDDIAVGGTLYSNMRYVIEKILRDNPCCKIFVITPLNSAKYGSEAANYGIGYPFSNNGTLEDIFQAEKRVAEYYGVGLIDMTHDSIVNRRNIAAVLPDKVHPSLSAHDLIARELAEKITFR